MTAAARKASFAGDPRRRVLIAKVHIAAKELGLDDDTYQGALFEVTGKMSAGEMETGELLDVLKHFEERGFKPRPGRRGKAGSRPAADHASARKARALWISLYHLGAIDNASERALEAFAIRQLGVTALQWANQAQCYKLIEALKAMAERHGWSQSNLPRGASASGKLVVLKARLCDAILVKLKDKGLAGEDWSLSTAATALCGVDRGEHGERDWSVEDYDLVARSFGEKLRGTK